MPASVKRLKMLSQPFGEDGKEGLPEALEETRTCLDLGNSAQWRLGRVYNYISDRELFKEKGFADTYLLLVHEFGEISRSWLSLCGQIANDYSEVEVKKYKVTLLSRLTTYKQVAHDGRGIRATSR